MTRKGKLLGAKFSHRFEKSYRELSVRQEKGVDKVVLALMKQKVTPGMRVKPVLPSKYYNEARINDADRIIFRIAAGSVWFVDVVKHDDIEKYGEEVSARF